MKEFCKSKTMAMLIQCYAFLKKYEKTTEAGVKLDTNNMIAEEYKLYLDTMNKVKNVD